LTRITFPKLVSIYIASEVLVSGCRLHRFTHSLSCNSVVCDCCAIHRLYSRAETVRTCTLTDRHHWSPSRVPYHCSPHRYQNGSRGDRGSLEVRLQHSHTLPKGTFRTYLIFLTSNLLQLVDCQRVVESGSSNDNAKVMGEYWSDRLDGSV
jgi:hypothetical protein